MRSAHAIKLSFGLAAVLAIISLLLPKPRPVRPFTGTWVSASGQLFHIDPDGTYCPDLTTPIVSGQWREVSRKGSTGTLSLREDLDAFPFPKLGRINLIYWRLTGNERNLTLIESNGAVWFSGSRSMDGR
jgi:hypothetical protein